MLKVEVRKVLFGYIAKTANGRNIIVFTEHY